MADEQDETPEIDDEIEDEVDDDDEPDGDFDLSGVAPAGAFYQAPEGYRSGFASFVGRPNAGKSTLTNALVGTKIVITSSKPQTTRNVVRGIVHREDAQLDPRRHPRPAPPPHAPRRAPQRPGQDHLGRGRRGGLLLPGQREDRPR